MNGGEADCKEDQIVATRPQTMGRSFQRDVGGLSLKVELSCNVKIYRRICSGPTSRTEMVCSVLTDRCAIISKQTLYIMI